MIDEALLEAEDKMDSTVEVAKEDLAGIRTGRANSGMFAKLLVDYYGAETPLQQLASFNIPEARTVLITPFDKSSMAAIEKTIRNSDLGVNPSNDGVAIRCNLPALTEERRKEYVKLARSKGEDAKVAIRNIRRKTKDEIDKAVKNKEIGEDEGRGGQDELEKLTKKHTDLIDHLMTTKEAELLEV